ncbi:MAG: hypothetical protein DRH57_00125 [Candidatus Cloacimonadota bacterium]|nr:MAG: hypothetical protein DRH57_00125 [Candidatus Cloacimonadota bacterium]
MKQWVYEARCVRCGKTNIFYMMGVSDKDIPFIKSKYVKNPFLLQYCEYCKKETLHKWLTIYQKTK